MTQEMDTVDVQNKDERLWGMLCHLIALSGFLIPIPLITIIAPLIIWLIKKDDMPFVDDQGKEAVNFQLTMLLAMIVSAILIFVVIGIFLMGAVLIFQLVMIIIASIKAHEGIHYRYPFAIRFIK